MEKEETIINFWKEQKGETAEYYRQEHPDLSSIQIDDKKLKEWNIDKEGIEKIPYQEGGCLSCGVWINHRGEIFQIV